VQSAHETKPLLAECSVFLGRTEFEKMVRNSVSAAATSAT
jgi:hypothetical protein